MSAVDERVSDQIAAQNMAGALNRTFGQIWDRRSTYSGGRWVLQKMLFSPANGAKRTTVQKGETTVGTWMQERTVAPKDRENFY